MAGLHENESGNFLGKAAGEHARVKGAGGMGHEKNWFRLLQRRQKRIELRCNLDGVARRSGRRRTPEAETIIGDDVSDICGMWKDGVPCLQSIARAAEKDRGRRSVAARLDAHNPRRRGNVMRTEVSRLRGGPSPIFDVTWCTPRYHRTTYTQVANWARMSIVTSSLR